MGQAPSPSPWVATTRPAAVTLALPPLIPPANAMIVKRLGFDKGPVDRTMIAQHQANSGLAIMWRSLGPQT